MTQLSHEAWNPDTACEEMAELFRRADEICSKPIYQEDASAGELEPPSADSLPTTKQIND